MCLVMFFLEKQEGVFIRDGAYFRINMVFAYLALFLMAPDKVITEVIF